MSFGSTITIVVNGGNKVLNKINQDSYGSEYLLRTSTEEYRMKIRNSKESVQKDGKAYDRHNVELTHTWFKTSTDPEKVRQAYVVLRNTYDENMEQVAFVDKALADFVGSGTVIADLLGWQS